MGQIFITECEVCHKEFEAKAGCAKYCSPPCRREAIHRSREFWADLMNKQKGASEHGERRCPNCYRFFMMKNGRQIFCSSICKEEYKIKAYKSSGKNIKEVARFRRDHGFTWEDVREVMARTGEVSYHKCIEILKRERG